jgi:hypothetical protein
MQSTKATILIWFKTWIDESSFRRKVCLVAKQQDWFAK